MYSSTPSISRFDEKTRKFITSKTINISNETNQLEHNDINEQLRILIEERLPDLCRLDNEPIEFTNGTKFSCKIKDVLTSDGEFWVERELSNENEKKFHYFNKILSLFAISYQSLQYVHIGQLVALYYESYWHRALVVSKSEQSSSSRIQPSARVRLVDNGSSLYVNVSQLKWLPKQFYLFPFKAVECVFSEAIKPTFSDTVRLTFKQLVSNKRLQATVYDRDGTRICVLLKCRTNEGIINVYRYLRAHEHKATYGRMLADGEIIDCLQSTIFNNTAYPDQSAISSTNLTDTMDIIPPSPMKLTREQLQVRRAEINKIYRESSNEEFINSRLTNRTPPSSTIITPMSHLSFAQQ